MSHHQNGMSQQLKELLEDDFLEDKGDLNDERLVYQDCFNEFISRDFDGSLSKIKQYGFLDDSICFRTEYLKLFLNICANVEDWTKLSPAVYSPAVHLLRDVIIQSEIVKNDLTLFNIYLNGCVKLIFENRKLDNHVFFSQVYRKLNEILTDERSEVEDNLQVSKLAELYFISLTKYTNSHISLEQFQNFCDNNANVRNVLEKTQTNGVSYYDLIYGFYKPKPVKTLISKFIDQGRPENTPTMDEERNANLSHYLKQQILTTVTKYYNLTKNYRISTNRLFFIIVILLLILQKYSLLLKLRRFFQAMNRSISPALIHIVNILSSV